MLVVITRKYLPTNFKKKIKKLLILAWVTNVTPFAHVPRHFFVLTAFVLAVEIRKFLLGLLKQEI